jgi:hypothetical protein
MDGAIHLERLRLYAASFAGEPVADQPRQIVGYGPLVYVLGGHLMNLLGERGWSTAVWVPVLFGAVGVVGTGTLAARLSRPWAAPAAAALLVGLPTWRTHSLDVMVDLPGTAWTVLAIACLVDSGPRSSRGRSRAWLAGAAVATGLALMTRWPMAFVLGPAWALAVLSWAGQAEDAPWQRVLGVLGLGALAGAVVVLPVALGGWGLVGWGRALLCLAAAGLGGGLVLGRDHWLLRALGAVLLMGAALWPATLWSPQGYLEPMLAQLALEEDWDQAGVFRPGLAGIPRGLRVLAQWVTGPWLMALMLAGTAFSLRRPRHALVVAVPAALNLAILFWLVAQPDDRHVLASVPLGVALGVALLAGLPGASLRGVLLGGATLVGLLGLGARHLPGQPGVVAADPWKRDVNLVREPLGPARIGFAQSGLPWVSLAPLQASPVVGIAALLQARFGDGPGCVAWLVAPELRDAVHLPRTSAELEAALMSAGSPLMGEEPTDRPGSVVGGYDGAVVFADPDDVLVERTQATLAPAQVVGTAAAARWSATVIVRQDTTPGDCADRFPGTEIRPIASGWAAAGAYPWDAPVPVEKDGQ